MAEPRAICLVVNAASGSNDEAAVDAVVAALEAAGAPAERVVRFPDDPIPVASELDGSGIGTIVTFTGDGTANAVVTRLEGWSGKVLVLPGGTQNLLARSLHGERNAAEIVAALGGGALAPVRRHLVSSRHGDGLCEVVAGPGAAFSDVREALRERDVGELASAAGEALRQTTAGSTVRVAEPALGKSEGYPAVRLHPAGGALAVDGYAADSLADYARQGLAILSRDFRAGPHDELGRHASVVLRSDAPIELMIDGERATGGREERFAIGPCGVTFLASPATDDA